MYCSQIQEVVVFQPQIDYTLIKSIRISPVKAQGSFALPTCSLT